MTDLTAEDYTIDGTINMLSKVHLVGQGKASVASGSFHNHTTTINLANNANATMVLFSNTTYSATLEKVYLNGNRDNNTGVVNGVEFQARAADRVMGNTVEDVVIFYCNGYGVLIDVQHREANLIDVRVLWSNEDGIRIKAIDSRLVRVQSGGNEKNGITIYAEAGYGASARMYDNDYHNNGQGGGAENTLNGMYFYGFTATTQMIGGHIDVNEGNGLYMVADATDGAPSRNTFIGVCIANNSQVTTNTYSQIKFYSAAGVGPYYNKFVGGKLHSFEDTTTPLVPKYAIEDNSATPQNTNTVTGTSFNSSKYGTGNVNNAVATDWHIDKTSIDVNTGQSVMGEVKSYKYITDTYTILLGDEVILCIGTFTVTLPAIATVPPGKTYFITNFGTGTITIDGDGAETINGAATISTNGQYETIMIYETSTAWAASLMAAP